MFAVIETGGKQHRVKAGDTIDVEKCAGEVNDKIELQSVLLILNEQGISFGPSALGQAKVVAQILRQDRAKKVLVFKKKRRKNYRRTRGHRQSFTRLKILDVIFSADSVSQA